MEWKVHSNFRPFSGPLSPFRSSCISSTCVHRLHLPGMRGRLGPLWSLLRMCVVSGQFGVGRDPIIHLWLSHLLEFPAKSLVRVPFCCSLQRDLKPPSGGATCFPCSLATKSTALTTLEQREPPLALEVKPLVFMACPALDQLPHPQSWGWAEEGWTLP